MMTSKLTWDQRFALIDRYAPSDAQATKALGISQAELDTARAMRAKGTIKASTSFDVEGYGNPFEIETSSDEPSSSTVTSTKSVKAPTSVKSIRRDSAPPETATKRIASPKKRGRKGTKIAEAFMAIPYTPVPVDEFAAKYGVSVPVLRQSKRFDVNAELGVVRVKTNKESGRLEIWREKQ